MTTKLGRLTLRRPRALIFLMISYLLWVSVSIRWVTEFIEANHPLTWLVSGMLVLYGILMGLEPWITRGSPWRAHLYLAFQTGLVMVAMLFYYELDFFAILLLPLCGQAVLIFPSRAASIWVIIFVLANIVGQIHQFGWPQGMSFIVLYIGALVFVAAFSFLTVEAEAARQKSEELLGELQEAHKQLQEYAGQTEELAIAKERNRLARELHDSVAQTLYGLTLQSEAAARKLAAGQTKAAEGYMRDIRQSALQTLQETRLLIFELRPPILEEEGLAAALRARLEAVEARSGLKTHIHVADIGRLPPHIEVGLYRLAQEALNNTLKHAQASQVSISLTRVEGKAILEVADNGIGFDPLLAESQGGMGLRGMRERAEQLGAKLLIESAPEAGTKVKVEASL